MRISKGAKGSIVRRKMNLKQTHQPLGTLHGVRYKARSIANPKGFSLNFRAPGFQVSQFSLSQFYLSLSALKKSIVRSEFAPTPDIAVSKPLQACNRSKQPDNAYWLIVDWA